MADKVKLPHQRKHLWERPKRADEIEPEVVEPSTYPHSLPRHIHHPDGRSKIVHTPQDAESHFEDGWTLDIDRTPKAPQDAA